MTTIKVAFPRPREAKALLRAGFVVRGNEVDLPPNATCAEQDGVYHVVCADGASFDLRKSLMADPPPPIEEYLKGTGFARIGAEQVSK